MRDLLTRLRCYFGKHKHLNVIQSFGSAQHIGCPDCGKQFGIHHGVRAVVPWDEDMAQMYRAFGYDVDGSLARWRRHRATLKALEAQGGEE